MRSRKFMWKVAVRDWRLHPLVGIGFVPEVPREIRPGVKNTFNGEKIGTPPIAGPHNSYLTVLARMGVIGAALMIILLVQYGWVVRQVARSGEAGLAELIMIYVPLSGFVYALFNSGFESPHNCVLLWLYFGMLCGRASRVVPARPVPPRPLTAAVS